MAMTPIRRPSAQTTAVVLAFSEQPATWRYGYDLRQQLGLKAGSLYPILMRVTPRAAAAPPVPAHRSRPGAGGHLGRRGHLPHGRAATATGGRMNRSRRLGRVGGLVGSAAGAPPFLAVGGEL